MTRRQLALVLVWTLPSALFLATTAIVYSAYRVPSPERLDAGERAAAMAPLRAALDGATEVACPLTRAGGRIAATVWLDGRAVVRADGDGDTLGAAVDAATRALRARPELAAMSGDARARARIQIDRVVGHAPLGDRHWLYGVLALPGLTDVEAVAPGIEGVGAGSSLVLPHELVTTKLVAAKQASDAAGDFAMGVDVGKVRALLRGEGALFRFRTDAFVEAPDHRAPPLALVRGNTAPPALSARALREAALAGGRFLVAHQAPSGRYIYEHDLVNGAQTDPQHGAYSMPRHAGTTYFLAELYRITKEEWLREPIERAIGHLVQLLGAGHCGGTLPDGGAFDCVLDRGETMAQLGSTALAVVALVEYQRATGDARYLPVAAKLAAFVLYMQRADGSFRHVYDPRKHAPDEHSMQFYASGEAALALARMYTITGEVRYARAAERALDWLVGWYDFFVGGFLYGEEHWTCIASEAIWPAAKNPAYRAFCDGYAAWSREQQPHPGDWPDEDDLAGAYGATPFVVPYNTPAGSRTEAMISTYLLDGDHGGADPRVREQIRLALQYLLGQQLRPDNDFAAVGPADGGIPASSIERTIRIDYVQHVCSAMIRASEVLDATP